MLTAETLREARWFGGKSRRIARTRTLDSASVFDTALSLVQVEYESGLPDTYVLMDHFDNPSTARGILYQFEGCTVSTERGGQLVFKPTHMFHTISAGETEPIKLLSGEQSNTSIRFGDALILKLFRRLQYGHNPDVEIGLFLTEHTAFRGTPPVAGSLTYTAQSGAQADVALLQQFEPNVGDAWTTTVRRVRSVLDGGDPRESIDAAQRLGATTAELHLALASGSGVFAPEPISDDDVTRWIVTMQEEVNTTIDALACKNVRVDVATLTKRIDGLRGLRGALKSRHHGDYHLGQVLERHDGTFAIIDFEGEPSRPLAQRREKRTPLRDVAGMLRSFDYARHTAVRSGGNRDRAAAWYTEAREAFLTAYTAVAQASPRLLPRAIAPVLEALELEKAAYEVMYELNNRPDWLPIPLAAFQECRL